MAAPNSALREAEHMTLKSVGFSSSVPSLRRAKSIEAHRQHFETIIKGSVADMRPVLEALASETVKDIGQGRDMAVEMLMSNLAHDLQRRLDRLVLTSIDKLWEEFDANKDRSLQKEETRKLVGSLLEGIAKNMDDLVGQSMQPAVESLQEWIYHDSTGPMGLPAGGGLHAAIDINIQARVKRASDKLTLLLRTVVQGLGNSANEIADEIFGILDTDGDGKLSKDEFVHGFAETFGHVLDFSKIVKLLIADGQRYKESALQRSGTASMEDVQGQLLSGLGLLALVGALILYGIRVKRQS